jgi:Tol biopolymer transport system component
MTDDPGSDDSDENSAATTSTGEAVTNTASAEPEPPPDGRIAFAVEEGSPAWSPNGTEIVFVRRTGRDWEIWKMSADGGRAEQLTFTPDAADKAPAWAPSDLIAFETDREGDWNIWTMEDDGGNQMQLIANEGVDDFSPAWAPSP